MILKKGMRTMISKEPDPWIKPPLSPDPAPDTGDYDDPNEDDE